MLRLTPIENPKSPLLKLAYWFSRRKLGKVITPMKTLYTRLPFAFIRWYASIQSLEKKLRLPEELKTLVRIYVAQINTCHFCIDIGQAVAIQQFDNTDRFFEVQEFEDSPKFSEAERAALRFAHELTVNKDVSDMTYQGALKHFSESQLVGITWLVASEHLYNLMNVAFHIESDGLCSIQRKTSTEVLEHS
ncbi:MAG: carboxymuconolactone decarboxylase family protein [Cyclobacteriaceae bacterium]